MSSPLKQNTTALQELLDKINQLPEAGNSGGGGAGGAWVFNGKAVGVVGVNGYASAETLVVDKSAFSSSAVAELTT